MSEAIDRIGPWVIAGLAGLAMLALNTALWWTTFKLLGWIP